MKGIALLEYLEGLYSGAGNHRRDGIGEEVRAGALTQHLDNLLAAGGETAHGAAKGLSEGAGEDIYAAIAVKLLCNAVAGGAYHACAVAFIHHHKGVVLFCKVTDLVHRGHIAVH